MLGPEYIIFVEMNIWKTLKTVRSGYWKVFWEINSTASNLIFQLIYLPFRNTFKEKSNNFEIECILCYSKCIALHFQPLYLVRLIDRWSTFHETRVNRLNEEHLLSRTTNKKKGKHVKYNVKVHSGNCSAWYMKRIWTLQYEFADARINWFPWH